MNNRANGGHARREKLTPERRSEIAKKAALARHQNKPPIAIRKGNFKEDFGFDVDCYVLNNETHTAVISQRGIGDALNLGDGGSRLTRFIEYQYMQDFIGSDLRDKLKNLLIFQVSADKSSGPAAFGKGYDATVLIDLCNAILSAKQAGERVSEKVIIQAQIIISACAKSGIQELVYKLSGFDSTREQFVSAFKQFIADEAKKYEREFPIELYEQWARLYQLNIPPRGFPWEFRRLTVNHIYYPLAKSNGKLLELLRESKEQHGDRRKKLFQFLNEIGTRALRMQLGRVLEMAESSHSRTQYEEKISQRFGGQMPLALFD